MEHLDETDLSNAEDAKPPKTRTRKVVTVKALFSQLKGGECYQRGIGKGSNLRIATSRAFADMYKHMKGRKTFTECTVQMTFSTEPIPEGAQPCEKTSE